MEGKAANLSKFISRLGSFEGRDILELGPHEGAITYLLEKENPKSILAVEGRSVSFLKCLAVKNYLGLKAQFLLGDFVGFLAETERQFDVIYASGVLYHMRDPLRLLYFAAQKGNSLALDTLYYDREKLLSSVGNVAAEWRLTGVKPGEFRGFSSPYYTHSYTAPPTAHPLGHGGLDEDPALMTSEDILSAIEGYGMKVTWAETYDADNGPHLVATATAV